MAVSWFALLVLGIAGLVLLAGVAVIVVLLANEKTRVVGIVLLISALFLLLAGLVIAGLLMWGIQRPVATPPPVHELPSVEWGTPTIRAILTPEAAASLGGR